MKKQNLIFALLLSVSCLVSAQVVAQRPLTKKENSRIDSLNASYNVETNRLKTVENRENLSDLKSQKADTKKQAKEARRIERDANEAARESRIAYRNEKQAQKARKQADKQARKAARARDISNEN
ncbi:hypothetical protein [Pseudochryseolinea flava]|uniref:Uncharacterized protein n=1 Tax=Pseudochryseolinea flava TaxID=2059302 RepID=A0A364Y5C0_9BACT|nr:hypothetical protein [Pseudochryseolinea flava]RAW02022.1 hypothetical protein DQQ10_05555 [Pseudochryseolinea flava]